MNSKKAVLSLLGLSALTTVGVKSCYDRIKFECNESPDPVLVQKLNEVRDCLRNHGLPLLNGHGLRFASSQNEGDLLIVRTAENLLGEVGLEIINYGHSYRDMCADGLSSSNEYYWREVGEVEDKDSFLNAKVEYSALLDEVHELCKFSDYEAPVDSKHCNEFSSDELGDLSHYISSVVQFDSPNGLCTGFFVDLEGDVMVATAKHCVVNNPSCIFDDDLDCETFDTLQFSWPKKIGEEASVKIFYVSYGKPFIFDSVTDSIDLLNKDVALIALSGDLPYEITPALSLSSAMDLGSGEYLGIGHSDDVSYSSASFNHSYSRSRNEEVYVNGRTMDVHLEHIEFKSDRGCILREGASGGPLVDLESGEVQGVLVQVSKHQLASDRTVSSESVNYLSQLAKTSNHFDYVHSLDAQLAAAGYTAFVVTSDYDLRASVLTSEGMKYAIFPRAEF